MELSEPEEESNGNFYYGDSSNPLIEKLRKEKVRSNVLSGSEEIQFKRWDSFSERLEDSSSGYFFLFEEDGDAVIRFRRIWWRTDSTDLVILDIALSNGIQGEIFTKLTKNKFNINEFYGDEGQLKISDFSDFLDDDEKSEDGVFSAKQVISMVIDALRLKREPLTEGVSAQSVFDERMHENVRFWKSSVANTKEIRIEPTEKGKTEGVRERQKGSVRDL